MQKLNEFVKKSEQGTLLGNLLFKRYYRNTKWIDNPLAEKNKKQLDNYINLFKKYGEQYDFDWLFLGAIAFQESHLDQDKKSKAGAVGIMQIKPSTAADKIVDIKGVEKNAEQNIHAAAKYLSFLRNRYFSGPEIDDITVGSIVYARSCDAAKCLAPKMIKKGTKAFLGYKRKFTVASSDTRVSRPRSDKLAKLFIEPANIAPLALLKGNTVDEANKRSKKEMMKKVLYMLSSVSTVEERSVASLLYGNVKGQVALGDTNATV